MAQIAYMIRDKNIDTMTERCLESLRKSNATCRIVLFSIDINDYSKIDRFNVENVKIEPSQWYDQRQACKIKNATKIPNINENDEIIVMDSDLLFNLDPFKVFSECNFDVFYTSRGYPYYYSVNAGVWGFKNNKSSREFLALYNSEISNPSWAPYINHIRKFGRRGTDWWVDQDFLCVVNDNKMSLEKIIPNIRLYDAGPKYNFCPSFDILGDKAVEQIKAAMNDKNIIILHLKGELKIVLGLTN